jgi:hypothetical protein
VNIRRVNGAWSTTISRYLVIELKQGPPDSKSRLSTNQIHFVIRFLPMETERESDPDCQTGV